MRCSWLMVVLFFVTTCAMANNSANFIVEGTVTGSTCKVVLGNGGLVNIPTQQRGKLANQGDVAGKTFFRISVTGCVSAATVYFQNDQATVSPAGRLFNTVAAGPDNGARNVELEILNSEGKSINLTEGKGAQGVSSSVPGATPDSANFDFFVQYYATGAATAGKVKSSLTFLVEY